MNEQFREAIRAELAPLREDLADLSHQLFGTNGKDVERSLLHRLLQVESFVATVKRITWLAIGAFITLAVPALLWAIATFKG
jgi:hypothetical protein